VRRRRTPLREAQVREGWPAVSGRQEVLNTPESSVSQDAPRRSGTSSPPPSGVPGRPRSRPAALPV